MSFLPIFATPRFRVFRAVFFLVFGFSAVFPFPHMVYLNGFDFTWPILWKEFLMGGAYTIGAVIYSTRVPERFYPGKLNCSVSWLLKWLVVVVVVYFDIFSGQVIQFGIFLLLLELSFSFGLVFSVFITEKLFLVVILYNKTPKLWKVLHSFSILKSKKGRIDRGRCPFRVTPYQ